MAKKKKKLSAKEKAIIDMNRQLGSQISGSKKKKK